MYAAPLEHCLAHSKHLINYCYCIPTPIIATTRAKVGGESDVGDKEYIDVDYPQHPLGFNYLSVSKGNRVWGLNYLENWSKSSLTPLKPDSTAEIVAKFSSVVVLLFQVIYWKCEWVLKPPASHEWDPWVPLARFRLMGRSATRGLATWWLQLAEMAQPFQSTLAGSGLFR